MNTIKHNQISHHGAACPRLLRRGCPSEPAQVAVTIGWVAQNVDLFQCPAPHHTAPTVAERLKSPSPMIAAKATGTYTSKREGGYCHVHHTIIGTESPTPGIF